MDSVLSNCNGRAAPEQGGGLENTEEQQERLALVQPVESRRAWHSSGIVVATVGFLPSSHPTPPSPTLTSLPLLLPRLPFTNYHHHLNDVPDPASEQSKGIPLSSVQGLGFRVQGLRFRVKRAPALFPRPFVILCLLSWVVV